ncbi:MAG: adenylate/guanylate cyclase domain-containing protein [Desulfamplus sp.]|nr:adenylate/guanylate cyclase domain-containing protein [Desulfamplus sp.]
MNSFGLKQSRVKSLRVPVMVSGVMVTILAVALYLANLNSIRLIDNRLYDLSLQISLAKNSNSKLNSREGYTSAIVDIDEYSLMRFGQWPWPRYRVAELLNKIHDAGAVAIGVDILFAEPDRTSLILIQKSLKQDFNIDITFSDRSHNLIKSHNLMDNDTLLAQAVDKTSATLGYYLNFQSDPVEIQTSDIVKSAISNSITNNNPNDLPVLAANISFVTGAEPDAVFRYMFKAVSIIPPIPVLINKDSSAGFMNALADNDGVLRRTPLFISCNQKIYPQLALAVILNSMKDMSANPMIKISYNGVESLNLESNRVYLDRNGSMLLNYRGPAHTFPYISAGKILENKVSNKDFKGKIIFIGSSAAGLKDIRISPVDNHFPGVEVHATIVDNILKSDFILRPDWALSLEVILTIVCGIVTTLLIGLTGALTTLILSIIVGSIIFFVSVWGLESHHIWISSLFPLITLLFNFTILNLVKYGLSEKDKKFYRSAFGRYVSKSVVNQIIESPEKFNLDGEEKEITVLFSDIRNFSAISEMLSPSQVSRLLHDYFTPVTKMIINHQGTLDKFIGDAIMCFWNAPINVDNHKYLALNAAMRILKILGELSSYFEKEYGAKIKTGVGIHSGMCRVGNMGSADLFDYTAIGDNVNIASRLEGLTKFYGLEIIFSSTMIPDAQKEIAVQYVDKVRVKGKTEPIDIYTAHLIEEGVDYSVMQVELDHYHHAIQLYGNRDFKEAFEIFSALDSKKGSSKKLYSIYRQRALDFINNPPDNEWDGVFNHITK